jgi:hypothetical protein
MFSRFVAPITLVTVLVLSSFANAESIKVCNASMKSFEDPTKTVLIKIDFVKTGDTLEGQINTSMGGHWTQTTQPAKVIKNTVRGGLSAKTNLDDSSLNTAEKMVILAMMATTDPVTRKIFSAGLDLTKVRSAKLYVVEQKAETLGMTVVVESQDQAGADLGSFLSGFLVLPCR